MYGITFDTGKAELKTESKPTLLEIAKMLKAQPNLKLHVVGHTDNVGTGAEPEALPSQAEAVCGPWSRSTASPPRASRDMA